ncbi:hypothetical protein [Bradyrhizobium barranii]
MALQFRKVGKAPRATRKQMGLAPVLPPNHCSHVVRFYTHRSKAAPCALRPDGTMTKLLNAYRAEPTIKNAHAIRAYDRKHPMAMIMLRGGEYTLWHQAIQRTGGRTNS